MGPLDLSDLFRMESALHHLVVLGGSLALALPIAWDRDRSEQTLGLRTIPLVALASASYVLLGQAAFGMEPGAQARLLQGLITGIGFLGGGAIVKEGVTVHGLSTGAAIWSTAAIGASVAHGAADVGLCLSVATFLTLRWLRPVKRRLEEGAESVEKELRDLKEKVERGEDEEEQEEREQD